MAKLLFNLCHLQHLKIAQQRLKFPKLVQMFAKYFKTIPKIAQRLIKIMSKWRNFDKSGHTDSVICANRHSRKIDSLAAQGLEI